MALRTKLRFPYLLVGFLCLTSGGHAGDAPKKIALIAGRKSHGPEGNHIHDYPWSVRLLKVMLDNSNVRERVRVEMHFDGWPADPGTLDDAASIMIISDGRDGDKYSEAPQFASAGHAALIERQMKRGCGFITFHFSTFAPEAYAKQILDWNGGYFGWEKDGQRQWYSAITTTEADLKLLAPEHPVARGVRPFRLKEEFYYNLRFQANDAALTPILSVPALPGREPDGRIVAWARQRADGGRGFGTTCGHYYDNWQNDQFRRLMLNAIVWSAGVEVPPGGVTARFYEHDEIMGELDRKLGRAAMPEFYEEPAAPTAELTGANGFPRPEQFRQWRRSHGDATSSRYSALTQINRDNVKDLAVAWVYHSQDGTGNIQCNPVIVDGVMYAPTAGNCIAAINAETGGELWRFKPEPTHGRRNLEDAAARRGLLFWKPENEGSSGRIFFTAGYWLYALNAGTGEPVRDFGEAGRAAIPTGGTAMGAVFKNVLVIPGYNKDVFGYDVLTGRLLWTFHTIPQPGEFGADTWSQFEQGANCWGGIALDEQRGIAYVSTGSPKPNFLGAGHRGQNLFGNCVLALDALTGKRLWHFQEIRHDIWDWDIPAPPNLVTVTREGKQFDAVAQVTKLGNTLLLDRMTGRPLFPFRLRRAPESRLPGEVTWPYQPDVQLPQPFAKQQFRPDDVTTRSDEAREFVLQRVARANYGWFMPLEEAKPTILYNIHGGAEWTGAAVDAATGHLFVSANELPWSITVFRSDESAADAKLPPTAGEQVYRQMCASCHATNRTGIGVAPPLQGLKHRLKDADVIALLKTGRNLMPAAPPMTGPQQKDLLDFLFRRDRPNITATPDDGPPRYTFSGFNKLLDHENYPGSKPPWGTLNCLDLNTGRLLWKVPLGEYDELTRQGIPRTGTENFGGAIVTAGGLVFCGGTRDQKMRAFNKENGQELWSAQLPWGGYAPPATYEVNGRQYVVIPATGGGKLGGPMGDAYVAFALPKQKPQ